jgi:uncharacterized repeat protein (TIGR03833 family)
MLNLFRSNINVIQERKTTTPINQTRAKLKVGMSVYIVEKQNQKSGILTKGIIKTILSPGAIHTRGIKVRLVSGQVGRVQCIIGLQKCNKNLTILNENINSILR